MSNKNIENTEEFVININYDEGFSEDPTPKEVKTPEVEETPKTKKEKPKKSWVKTLIWITSMLAVIVMNDAMGVRYETGKQAKVINQLVKEIFSGQSADVNKNLKELVGHTPLQVLVGALLGAAVPFAMMLIMK